MAVSVKKHIVKTWHTEDAEKRAKYLEAHGYGQVEQVGEKTEYYFVTKIGTPLNDIQIML